LATSDSGPVDVNRAGSAQPHSATELGTGQLEGVTQNPEQRHIRMDVYVLVLSVDVYCHSSHQNPPWKVRQTSVCRDPHFSAISHRQTEVCRTRPMVMRAPPNGCRK